MDSCWAIAWLAVVDPALVDDVRMESEGVGDLVEKPGAGEEPLPPGALATGAAMIGSLEEAMEGCPGRVPLNGCQRGRSAPRIAGPPSNLPSRSAGRPPPGIPTPPPAPRLSRIHGRHD